LFIILLKTVRNNNEQYNIKILQELVHRGLPLLHDVAAKPNVPPVGGGEDPATRS